MRCERRLPAGGCHPAPVGHPWTRGAAVPPAGGDRKLQIDLQRLAALPARQAGPLARYASTIQSQRDDYNGKVLTIRERDLQSLAVVDDVQPDNLTEMLITWGVLAAEPPAGLTR